jgi:hypothetical protein
MPFSAGEASVVSAKNWQRILLALCVVGLLGVVQSAWGSTTCSEMSLAGH